MKVRTMKINDTSDGKRFKLILFVKIKVNCPTEFEIEKNRKSNDFDELTISEF